MGNSSAVLALDVRVTQQKLCNGTSTIYAKILGCVKAIARRKLLVAVSVRMGFHFCRCLGCGGSCVPDAGRQVVKSFEADSKLKQELGIDGITFDVPKVLMTKRPGGQRAVWMYNLFFLHEFATFFFGVLEVEGFTQSWFGGIAFIAVAFGVAVIRGKPGGTVKFW